MRLSYRFRIISLLALDLEQENGLYQHWNIQIEIPTF